VKIKFDRKEVKHFKNNRTNGKNEIMNDIESLKKNAIDKKRFL